IDRACLLAEAAIDTLHHIDVVACGPARAVIAPRPRLDSDRLRRADRLAELAGDAALLAVRIAPQRVLAAEARRQHALFERIVERRLRPEEIAHGEEETRDELGQEQRAGGKIQSHRLHLGASPENCKTAATMTTIVSEIGKNTFQPSRIN